MGNFSCLAFITVYEDLKQISIGHKTKMEVQKNSSNEQNLNNIAQPRYKLNICNDDSNDRNKKQKYGYFQLFGFYYSIRRFETNPNRPRNKYASQPEPIKLTE